jgi:hypothetical protein
VFKELFNFLRELLFLQRDMERLKQDVATLQRELSTTNEALKAVVFELQRMNEREAHERQKLELKLENILLRERGLPPPKLPKKLR